MRSVPVSVLANFYRITYSETIIICGGETMKLGILSAGNIAGIMAGTVRGMKKSGVELYAVGARSAERAQEFAQKYGVQKAYGSYEELAADPEVDLIYIGTPHSHHYECAKLCLEHGKPVLIEKSFTANAEQARELVRLAEEKGLFLTEAIWTRYMPSRAMINELISSGTIGNVTSLSANLCYPNGHLERMKNPELAGGALLDLGVYPLNFAAMVFGSDVRSIHASVVKTETGVDAQDSIMLEYADGRCAFIYASMQALSDRRGMINGTEGYIEVENINNPEVIRVYNAGRKLIRTLKVPKQITGYEYEVLACRDALDAGRTECPEMPHAETIRIMEMMDEIRSQNNIRFPFEEQ